MQDEPEHVLAHEELVAVEEDARDVAEDEDKDDADENKGQVDLDIEQDQHSAQGRYWGKRQTNLLFG